jgi:hypothetical protein
MVISMTNRLLAVVMALAFTSGVVAHAAGAPQRPIVPTTFPAASSLPTTIETAASRLSETATGAVDPSGAIRDAYQRDHVALERVRQQASLLKGSAHPAFNQYISDQEAALTELERTALATTRPSAGSTIDAMDNLVAATQARLDSELQSGATKSAPAGQHNGAGAKTY